MSRRPISIYAYYKNKLLSFLFLEYARIRGFRFKIAETSSELDDVYRFRWRIYKDEGFINADDHPDKKFTDKYDPYSVNFISMHKNEIIGTVRLTKNSKEGNPTLNNFNVHLPDYIDSPDNVVEIGRYMIDKRFRGQKRIVSFGLSVTFYKYSLKYNYRWWTVHMPLKLREAFSKFGVEFDLLPELPPEDKHIRSRGVIAGYFQKADLKPMLADIHTIAKW